MRRWFDTSQDKLGLQDGWPCMGDSPDACLWLRLLRFPGILGEIGLLHYRRLTLSLWRAIIFSVAVALALPHKPKFAYFCRLIVSEMRKVQTKGQEVDGHLDATAATRRTSPLVSFLNCEMRESEDCSSPATRRRHGLPEGWHSISTSMLVALHRVHHMRPIVLGRSLSTRLPCCITLFYIRAHITMDQSASSNTAAETCAEP
ncbi:hypothetical protein V8F33_008678 [Rhypophila sp. PSN 637]